MKTFIPARLRVPLAYALAGAILAAAWAVRGGPAWWLSIVIAVILAAGAFGYVFGLQQFGGEDDGVADDADAGLNGERFPAGR